MTYGVPYSFVPGTKAKADEVNANFIDVLDKIQTTNERIDETNTTILTNETSTTSKLDQKANLDLSNLSSTGKSLFDKKANATDLDDKWVRKHTSLASGKAIGKGVTHNYSLSSYLPSSGIYEVIVALNAQTASVAGAFVYLQITSDFIKDKVPVLKAITRQTNTAHAAGMQTIIVGTSRSISVYNASNTSNEASYEIDVYAYRKVR